MNTPKLKFAILAAELGLPVPRAMELLRETLGIDCPYCQLATKVLRKVRILGREKTLDLLKQILAAKQSNDKLELSRLKKEFQYGDGRSSSS